MKKYYALINGEKLEVTKDVHDVLDGNTGEFRRERYLNNEVRQKNEVSLEELRSCEYPIELHISTKSLSVEEELLQDEKYQYLHKALRQLNPIEKEVIKALYFNAMTERQAALKLEKHKTTIHRIKITALKKLKNSLFQYFDKKM